MLLAAQALIAYLPPAAPAAGSQEFLPSRSLGGFYRPCGAAVDRNGALYVASGTEIPFGSEGRIDIFSPGGQLVTSIPDPYGPCSLAVDSQGTLYVNDQGAVFEGGFREFDVAKYVPSEFPVSPSTVYAGPTRIYGSPTGPRPIGIAVDPSNDHLYVDKANRVAEYDSAANGSALLNDSIGLGVIPNDSSKGEIAEGVDVFGANHDVYVAGTSFSGGKVYVFDGSDGHLKETIDGSNVPGSSGFAMSTTLKGNSVAVDQSDGSLYVADLSIHHVVDHFAADGAFLSKIGPKAGETQTLTDANPSDIVVDNAGGSGTRDVFITSGETTGGSVFAFAPLPPECRPKVADVSAAQITHTEALVQGRVNPCGKPTTYRFEYVSAEEFESSGYANALSAPIPDASIGEGGADVSVSQGLVGLAPGRVYHFRLIATNEDGATTSADQVFATYPKSGSPPSCPNAALRRGPSALLPDCRAYELVTPADTGGLNPLGSLFGIGGMGTGAFNSWLAAPSGESLAFNTRGGVLPGMEGNGVADAYRSDRGASGWHTESIGPTGAEATHPNLLGVSPEHDFLSLNGGYFGGSLTEPPGAGYLRIPGGSYQLIGVGSLGTDPLAQTRWISAGGSHIIFVTGGPGDSEPIQLEPQAPPTGVSAIYDRTLGGPTHVVSLLPDGTAAEAAKYLGASADGTAVAFSVGGAMYVRLDDEVTKKVTDGPEAAFEGISGHGSRVFYLLNGDIFAYDTASGETNQIGSGGASTVVNISADGSHVYFVSTAQLDGAKGVSGAENLYVWNGSSVRFIAVLEHEDVVGRESQNLGQSRMFGLGLWAKDVVGASGKGAGNDPSRTTPDGSVLVFEAQARLTSYDNGGHREVYRYDAAQESLLCVSCSPTFAPAAFDGRLLLDEEEERTIGRPSPPTSVRDLVPNVVAGGDMVFFETREALVPEDTNGRFDVYEWEADGHGACALPSGCLHLISDGTGSFDSYLYGVGADGRDVFITTSDALVGADEANGGVSVYDARIGGGFSEAEAPVECTGEDCRPASGSSPPLSEPGSSSLQDAGREAAGPCGRLAARAQRLRRQAQSLRHRARALRGRAIRRRAERLLARARLKSVQASRLALRARRCRHAGSGRRFARSASSSRRSR